MKKFTLLLIALLGVVGTQAQVEYVAYQPAAPVTVSWNSGGNQPSYNGSYFKVSKDDVIKVHVTNVSSSDYQAKVVWKGTDGSGWEAENAVTTTDGEFTYTVASDEIATSINNYGIALSGVGYSMLDITVQTSNVTNADQTFFEGQSYDMENWKWDNRVVLSPWVYNFAQMKAGDQLNISYTTYSTVGTGDVHGQIQVTDGTTTIGDTGWNDTPSNIATLSITLTDAMITQLRTGDTRITGQNVYVNSMTLVSSNYTYNQTVSSESKYFGNWNSNYEPSGADCSATVEGDVLCVSYVVPNEKTDGCIFLRDKSNSWNQISGYVANNLSGTGTVCFPINATVLALLKEGNIAISGSGAGGTDNTNGVLGTGVSITHYATIAGYRPVYIPASEYATFYATSTCALPDDVEAYYVSETTSESAKLTSISNIPANQGVILHGTPGIYQVYTTTDDAASVTENKLVGATTRTEITNELAGSAYMLYNNGGTPEFRKMTEGTKLDAYKCYLNTAGAGARLNIVFDDNETTGINAAAMNKVARDNAYYTLSGQRVAQPTKGLYIVNGKKVIIK